MDHENKGAMAQVEDSAIDLLRKARQTFENMGNVGYRIVGLTDWLEAKVPVVGNHCRNVLHAALDGLTNRPSPKDRE